MYHYSQQDVKNHPFLGSTKRAQHYNKLGHEKLIS